METGGLAYITIPPNVAGQFHHMVNEKKFGFSFDPAIPLPVELPPGKKHLSGEELSVEMILSGILLDLAENPEGRNSGYYRRLATAVKPGLSAELLDAAAAKTRGGDYDTALEIFRLVEGLYPDNQALPFNRALTLERRAFSLENAGEKVSPAAVTEALEAASTAWEKALSNPALPEQSPDTFFYAAFFYEKRGDYARAAHCLTVYLEAVEDMEGENNKDDSGYDVPAENTADEAAGEKKAKARELLAEIRNNGLDDDSFREALVLIRQGEEEQGIQKVREFLQRRPGAARGWFLLGWGLRRLSRWEDGTACFEKAMELGCVNADTRNELAICRMETGGLAAARHQLEEALHFNPDNVKIISNLGVLAMKEGNSGKAAAFFRTVLELEPDDPVARAFFKTA